MLVRRWTCCMCPVKYNGEFPQVCPAGHECEFNRTFVDKNGFIYEAGAREGLEYIKAREELNLLATKNGWKVKALDGTLNEITKFL